MYLILIVRIVVKIIVNIKGMVIEGLIMFEVILNVFFM